MPQQQNVSMTQMISTEAEFANKKRKNRRDIFPERMDKLILWTKLEKKLRKHYPRTENGRPPYPLPSMLRVHCLQLFYNLRAPAMEDALYKLESMRRFAGLRLSERIPDETTILSVRHFLEKRGVGQAIFDTVNRNLAAEGLVLK
tara:strand:- start:4412 stop:4846 length:435 start_codon:yes stop_codon:yes gene_type:complete